MGESTVGHIMTEFIQTIPAGSTVMEAAKIMSTIGIGSIVVTAGESPVGMLTERDIVKKVTSRDITPSRVSVEDVMSRPIITTSPDKIIDEAALMMSVYGIRRLVVVDGSGRLAGVVTATDIASWLSRNENYQNNALNAIARMRASEKGIPYG